MWSAPRNLRKIAILVIALMALAGFVSGILGARDVAYLPGEAPASPSAPAVTAPEVTPLPTDLPPPPEPEPEEEEKPEPEAPKPEDKPKPAAETPAPAPSAKTPAGQDAVGDLIQGADAATTQPPPY
jgi:outer membrane biosynthesis protein TonB